MNAPLASNPGSARPERLAPSLAQQLAQVARCVQAVEQGRSLNEVLPQVPAPLRAGVQALTFHVLRHLGTCHALVAVLVDRRPEPALRALLCSALALLLVDPDGPPGAAPRYTPHTVVDQAVNAAKVDRSLQRKSAFVNACLRRFLREQPALLERVRQQPEARWNHPAWWVEQLRRDHPEHWQAMLEANNQPGPMALRVNRRQATRESVLAALAAADVPATAFGEDGVVLSSARPVEQLPGFAEGHWSVQDGAAQLAAGLLLAGRIWTPTDRVLDACAAPGGKTAHVLEHAEVQMLALDVDAARCERIRQTLERLHLSARVQCADAARVQDWWDGVPFDAILLDAPCTASGIVRRHPDVRWLRRPGDIAQLAKVQRMLLEALWPLLRPGGRLVYATCSVFRAEGESQVQAFLERHTDAVLRPSPGHLRPGEGALPGEFNDNRSSGYDGFFYARLDKASA